MIRKSLFIFYFFYALVSTAQTDNNVTSKETTPNSNDYTLLHILQQKVKQHQNTPLKIAIIDDGFRLTHKSFKNYIYTNQKEIPGNLQDDDKNGYVDDMHGWDVSDNDNDVTVKKGNEAVFYHGTYIASIITSFIEKAFGPEASKLVKIIPIKAVPDHAKNTYLKDGYKGFQYAQSMGADIICCAWSGGVMTNDDKLVINNLLQKGTLIIAAAGNLFSEEILTPASIDGVICVAAIDSLERKIKESNYGMRVDLAAPGTNIYGAYPEVDNSFIYEGGTSPATAIISGCVAILKLCFPSATSIEITDALKNTATPIDSLNLRYSGKLGAGIPNIEKAIEFLSNSEIRYSSFDSARSKGKIYIKKTKKPQQWTIHPAGAFRGIHLYANNSDNKGDIMITNADTICYQGKIGDLLGGRYLLGNSFKILFHPHAGNYGNTTLSYYLETIDSTKLYCSGLNTIEVTGDGILTDNSAEHNYANNCSCQWQLIAPTGKKISIEMLEMDTEPNTDYIWFFDGEATLPERLLAKFSGITKPPTIQSLSNKLLIWFLTDSLHTGKGWKMSYKLID